jgi:hypothetical protein
LYQIADVLDAGKLRLILPLRKGNALGLAEREFITLEEAHDAFERLTELRATHDWRPAVRMTPWTAETEGHMNRASACAGLATTLGCMAVAVQPGLAGSL